MTRILLIDDEWDVCDFMMRFFKERNFEVFTATNGTDALQITKENCPHIVLLDIRMKDMDGMEILKGIKRINSETKVVMVTCVDDSGAMREAKNLGAIAYITKPLVLNSLMEVVLSNIGRHRSFFNLRRRFRNA